VNRPKFLLFKAELDDFCKNEYSPVSYLDYIKCIFEESKKIKGLSQLKYGFVEFESILILDQDIIHYLSKNLSIRSNKAEFEKRLFYHLEMHNKLIVVVNLINEIINSQTTNLVRIKSKNLSIDERMLITNTNISENKSRKSVFKGGFELVTSASTNNRFLKEDSSDSLEVCYKSNIGLLFKRKRSSHKKQRF
jgi:hypothetical protein